ncbi:MAG: beta-ketoacyl-ACP synthase [Solirubrobacterales bacterium]
MTPLFIPAMAVASCLGVGKAATVSRLFAGARVPLPVGAIPDPLPDLDGESRNNRLLAALLAEIEAEARALVARFGPHRVAVVVGTSTSGIAEGEAAVAHHRATGQWPAGFSYRQQETGSPAEFVARRLGITGPAYVVATACSSSAKTFAAARRLIAQGVVDAAVVGGADTLCKLTVAGFTSLESVSRAGCNPFGVNRDGITIGEGGALFLLTPEPAEIALLGVAETSDAHHVSAPDPSGAGALAAMRGALDDAGLSAADIAYLNLHGTATPLNDAMECRAVHSLFGAAMPCSSTKAMTGHTLGAAGAVEAAFLWLTLSEAWNPGRLVPPHLWDGVADPQLPVVALAKPGTRLSADRRAGLSSSFAFGGSNCALVLGRGGAP